MSEVDINSPFFIKYRKMFAEMDEKADEKIIAETIKKLKEEAEYELLEDLNSILCLFTGRSWDDKENII